MDFFVSSNHTNPSSGSFSGGLIREGIAALREAMDRVLTEEDGIRSKRWWTCEEFNSPRLNRQKRG